jgi:hypothetical protein
MNGLVNRAIQAFARDTRGPAFWADLARQSGAPFNGFEPMLAYDPAITDALLSALAKALDCPVSAVLEDLGTYLVADPRRDGLRRLLRFGGAGFADFLHSIAELPARLHLALPDIDLPHIDVAEVAPDLFHLSIAAGMDGLGHVALGLVRAMADDYGALAVLDLQDGPDGTKGAVLVTVRLLDAGHASARDFTLGVVDALA